MNNIIVSIKLAYKNLRNNLGRTLLSLTGIVIGVMAVIIVLSFGAGLKSYVIGQVESFGTDMIEIEIKVPNTEQTSSENISGIVGGTVITSFKLEDAEKVSQNPNLGDWYAGIISQQIVSHRENNEQLVLFGTTAGVLATDENMKLAEGEMYLEEDDENLKQVIVLGSEAKKDLFGNNDAIGKNVKIKGQSYKVIGTLKERGLVGGMDFDSMGYMPVQTLQKKIMGVDHVIFALFRVKNMKKIDLTVLEMEEIMRDQHDIDDPDDDDFAVFPLAEAIEIVEQVFSALNILLLALTSISLIVGGVGIMNVMYVSVTERTSEIGLRKAVGAKNSDVLKQFLFESIFLTLVGGGMGILIGFFIAEIATYFAVQRGFFLKFEVTFISIIIALGFSAGVGILFGFRPAQKASKLSPMEALRKE